MRSSLIIPLIAALFAVSVTGCSSVQTYGYKSKPNDASIFVTRKAAFNAGGVGAIVQIDGQNVAKLGGNDHTSIPVSPGKHQVGVKATTTVQPDSKEVTVSPNQKRYFIVEANAARFASALVPLADLLAVKTFLLKESSEEQFRAIASRGKERTVTSTH
jgi:hypothetical protein